MKKLSLMAGLALAVLMLALPPLLKNYGLYLMSYYLVFVLACMGLNLTIGYAGQKSLGHAAFFGIGAYTLAILLKTGFSWWLGLPAAAALCFALGLLLGFPALRVQTIYLAFATLGFNTAVWLFIRNEEWLTGGTFGINNVTRPALLGFEFDSNLRYYYFVLGVTVILGLLLLGLLRSPWGKAFTALRDNPIRAESLGISVRSYTLLSFAIGAAYAGVAGALFASLVEFIEPAPFTVAASIMMYLMVVVGGPGHFFGPVLGVAVGVLLPEWIRDASQVLANWYLPLFGLAVVALMVWLPDGLLSLPERLRNRQALRATNRARQEGHHTQRGSQPAAAAQA